MVQYFDRFEHVNDLFKAINGLDSVGLLPDVAAQDLDRIPSVLPEELNLLFVVQRLKDLERSRDEHNDILTNMVIDIINIKYGNRPVDTVTKDTSIG